jgi:hypothetical protein
MTATAAGFGLRPSYHPSGVIRPVRRVIAPAYTTAIYKGDLVLIVAAGIELAASNSGRGDGVFVGCEYTDSTGKRHVSPYWPGTASCTDIVAWVIEDPDAIFDVQATGAVALTDIGSHAGISTANGTGSAFTGLSLGTLLQSSISTTTENQLVIVDLVPQEDNAWGDAYTLVRVKLGRQAFRFPPDAF